MVTPKPGYDKEEKKEKKKEKKKNWKRKKNGKRMKTPNLYGVLWNENRRHRN